MGEDRCGEFEEAGRSPIATEGAQLITSIPPAPIDKGRVQRCRRDGPNTRESSATPKEEESSPIDEKKGKGGKKGKCQEKGWGGGKRG